MTPVTESTSRRTASCSFCVVNSTAIICLSTTSSHLPGRHWFLNRGTPRSNQGLFYCNLPSVQNPLHGVNFFLDGTNVFLGIFLLQDSALAIQHSSPQENCHQLLSLGCCWSCFRYLTPGTSFIVSSEFTTLHPTARGAQIREIMRCRSGFYRAQRSWGESQCLYPWDNVATELLGGNYSQVIYNRIG